VIFTNCNFDACHIDPFGDYDGKQLGAHTLFEHGKLPRRELPTPDELWSKAFNDLLRNKVEGEIWQPVPIT